MHWSNRCRATQKVALARAVGCKDRRLEFATKKTATSTDTADNSIRQTTPTPPPTTDNTNRRHKPIEAARGENTNRIAIPQPPHLCLVHVQARQVHRRRRRRVERVPKVLRVVEKVHVLAQQRFESDRVDGSHHGVAAAAAALRGPKRLVADQGLISGGHKFIES